MQRTEEFVAGVARMVVREVALDRDVRSPRLRLSGARLASVHTVRRAVSVGTLITLDAGSWFLACMLVSVASEAGALSLWRGLSWRGFAGAGAVIIVVAALKGLYGRRHVRKDFRRILSAWVIAFTVTLMMLLLLDPRGIGARLVVAWLLAFVLAFAGRALYDALISLVYGADADAMPALLLGSPDVCRTAMLKLAALPPESRVTVVGLVVPAGHRQPAHRLVGVPPVVGTSDSLREALRTSGAAEVIIADHQSLNGQLRSIMDTCRDSRVTLKIVLADHQEDAATVVHVPGMDCPLFAIESHMTVSGQYVAKQALDVIVSALLLVLLSPLLLAIAAAIKLTSAGPVLFVDERIGVGQRSFRCYKFRTMVADARETQESLEPRNEAGGVLFKIRDDPRITRVGRVLRRLSLDELPQLFNVLKRDMSLVGPRPLPLRDCGLMQEWQRRRHVVLPGMTGLWQVSGRSDLDFDDMARLDLQYIETWSLKSDLRIVWRTAGVVVRSRGAH
jgi:exopolysaccharide biosynthesis polyprenyl glycosylphosphotransferase